MWPRSVLPGLQPGLPAELCAPVQPDLQADLVPAEFLLAPVPRPIRTRVA
jgi:hypothetical protein